MPKKENLIGQKFNKLTVLKEVPKDQRKNKKMVEWECLCDCGKTTTVITNYLKTGHTKSCGCWRKENATILFSSDLTGQKFGKLSVIKETNKRGADGCIVWECKCDCGNIHYATTNSLK